MPPPIYVSKFAQKRGPVGDLNPHGSLSNSVLLDSEWPLAFIYATEAFLKVFHSLSFTSTNLHHLYRMRKLDCSNGFSEVHC